MAIALQISGSEGAHEAEPCFGVDHTSGAGGNKCRHQTTKAEFSAFLITALQSVEPPPSSHMCAHRSRKKHLVHVNKPPVSSAAVLFPKLLYICQHSILLCAFFLSEILARGFAPPPSAAIYMTFLKRMSWNWPVVNCYQNNGD